MINIAITIVTFVAIVIMAAAVVSIASTTRTTSAKCLLVTGNLQECLRGYAV